MMSGESLCPHHIHQSEEKQEKPTDMPARRQFIIKLMSLGIQTTNEVLFSIKQATNRQTIFNPSAMSPPCCCLRNRNSADCTPTAQALVPQHHQIDIDLSDPQAPEGNVHEATAMPAMTPLL
jgi:hypothetical protein